MGKNARRVHQRHSLIEQWTSRTHLMGRLMIKNMHAVYTKTIIFKTFLNPNSFTIQMYDLLQFVVLNP